MSVAVKKKPGRKSTRPALPPDALGSRIRAAREKANLSLAKLGDLIGGMSNEALSKIETGATKEPQKHTLAALARELKDDFGLAWLRDYIPPSFESILEKTDRRVIAGVGGAEVLVLGRVAAGKPIQAFPDTEKLTIPAAMFHRHKQTFALQVQGESMKNFGIFHGDIIILHECPEPTNGAVVVVRINDDVTLKKWHRKGQRIVLSPDNPDFDKIEIETKLKDVQCLGEYVGLIRFAR